MKVIHHFHGEQATQLYYKHDFDSQFLQLLSMTSIEKLRDIKQLNLFMDNIDPRKPIKTQYLSELTFNYIVGHSHSIYLNLKDKVNDAKQNINEFKNHTNLSDKIKNFQTNYAHEKNHEIHEEVKVILFGMIGCCLYYSVLGHNESPLNRIAAGLAAMFFSGVLVRQNVMKKYL